MDEDQYLAVVAAVEEQSTNAGSYLHGSQHWKCVSKLGIHLARNTPDSDVEVAFLFGLFHDSMRHNDDSDPEHGIRGANLVSETVDEGVLVLRQPQIDALRYACATHTGASPTDDPVVGVCYDADRLNLWRVGTAPSPEYISTIEGHKILRSGTALLMHGSPLYWPDVIRELCLIL